ncbi:MAG: hypothetical protein JW867_05525 [Candidatus Omnitrophica bacterium]|nr:hypothetical protein [Candidatus Omnitrophota bacterium]
MAILQKIRRSKAQSILEYTALIVVASVAVGYMVLYVQRAVNVRMRHLRQELNESQR